MEADAFGILRRHILDIATVIGRQYYIGDSGSLGRKNFLAYSAYGQHFASKGYLTRHSDSRRHTASGKCRNYGRGDSDTGRRSVLGNGSFWEMHVENVAVEYGRVDSEPIGIGLNPLVGYRSRFLHHVAEMAGKTEGAVFSCCKRGFRHKYLASGRRPSKASDNTGDVIALVLFGKMRSEAEQLVEMLGKHRQGEVVSAHLLQHGLAGYRRKALVEMAHSAFRCV